MHQNVESVRAAIRRRHDSESKYQKRLDANPCLHYLRPEPLSRFLDEAIEIYDAAAPAAQWSSAGLSDEALLGLAFEIERVGISPDCLASNLRLLKLRESRMIMEAIGAERTTVAIRKLMPSKPVADVGGKVQVSTLPPLLEAQWDLHRPYHMVYEWQ